MGPLPLRPNRVPDEPEPLWPHVLVAQRGRVHPLLPLGEPPRPLVLLGELPMGQRRSFEAPLAEEGPASAHAWLPPFEEEVATGFRTPSPLGRLQLPL